MALRARTLSPESWIYRTGPARRVRRAILSQHRGYSDAPTPRHPRCPVSPIRSVCTVGTAAQPREDGRGRREMGRRGGDERDPLKCTLGRRRLDKRAAGGGCREREQVRRVTGAHKGEGGGGTHGMGGCGAAVPPFDILGFFEIARSRVDTGGTEAAAARLRRVPMRHATDVESQRAL
ncbi:hypothetical protein B0H14DRAFT_2605666 [Mycena olivaceomarginata]|nr:hypothetical protein B0H14DRAFT_2605666 [Mycena olivaceomarginata]